MTERYLFMALTPAAVRAAMQSFLARHGLDAALASAPFAAENWHQSLSDRYCTPAPDVIAALHQAGSLIAAQAVRLRFNRLNSHGRDPVHWAFRARGRPGCFVSLVTNIRSALNSVGLACEGGHTPHMTVSYRAPGHLATLALASPIDWLIEEVALVRSVGQGKDYRYEVQQRWKLQPPPPSAQLELFGA